MKNRIVQRFVLVVAITGLVPYVSGCFNRPVRIKPPRISAKQAAREALKLYDEDGDGFIAGEELVRASGLKAAMATLDTDEDGKVSAAEIEARIRSWQESEVGLSSITCEVTLDGEPLEGATVIFEPEPFLGNQIQAAVGVTRFDGMVSPSIPKENRPTPTSPHGMQLGLYKIRVSKTVDGKETIPSRYNADTILGQQVSLDDPELMTHLVKIKLSGQ